MACRGARDIRGLLTRGSRSETQDEESARPFTICKLGKLFVEHQVDLASFWWI
jgi:hypothetical protein